MDNTFGKAIQAARQARGWSVSDVASKVGALGAPTSWRTVQEWEQGRRCPRPEAMEALSALGLKATP